MKKPNESDLVRSCLQWLTFQDYFCWRVNTGAVGMDYKGRNRFVRFGLRGTPDIIGILPGGRFFGVECKMSGRRQTTQQQGFQSEIERNGGLYLLVYSLEELQQKLDAI